MERERATGILHARISAQTVRNRLREIGARPRRHYVGANLTLRHQRNRAHLGDGKR